MLAATGEVPKELSESVDVIATVQRDPIVVNPVARHVRSQNKGGERADQQLRNSIEETIRLRSHTESILAKLNGDGSGTETVFEEYSGATDVITAAVPGERANPGPVDQIGVVDATTESLRDSAIDTMDDEVLTSLIGETVRLQNLTLDMLGNLKMLVDETCPEDTEEVRSRSVTLEGNGKHQSEETPPRVDHAYYAAEEPTRKPKVLIGPNRMLDFSTESS